MDYLDKTISISKINFNPRLGVYQLSEKELEALGDQRTVRENDILKRERERERERGRGREGGGGSERERKRER